MGEKNKVPVNMFYVSKREMTVLTFGFSLVAYVAYHVGRERERWFVNHNLLNRK